MYAANIYVHILNWSSGLLFIQAMFESSFIVMKRCPILGIVFVFGYMVDRWTCVYRATARHKEVHMKNVFKKIIYLMNCSYFCQEEWTIKRL